jgi:hypothetical protein
MMVERILRQTLKIASCCGDARNGDRFPEGKLTLRRRGRLRSALSLFNRGAEPAAQSMAWMTESELETRWDHGKETIYGNYYRSGGDAKR